MVNPPYQKERFVTIFEALMHISQPSNADLATDLLGLSKPLMTTPETLLRTRLVSRTSLESDNEARAPHAVARSLALEREHQRGYMSEEYLRERGREVSRESTGKLAPSVRQLAEGSIIKRDFYGWISSPDRRQSIQAPTITSREA